MRTRLKLAGYGASPESAVALALLLRIQRQTVTINDSAPITGVTSINTEQAVVLAAFKPGKPSPDPQMSLLWWQL